MTDAHNPETEYVACITTERSIAKAALVAEAAKGHNARMEEVGVEWHVIVTHKVGSRE